VHRFLARGRNIRKFQPLDIEYRQRAAEAKNRAAQTSRPDIKSDWRRFECRSSVSTWLMSIARHKALSARRRRTEAELDEKIEATAADPADDPEVALQEKNRDELLRRALTRLSREHREVIDLVYYHEKSVDEVAHILDVPSATVKTRMFYARKKLLGGRVSSSPEFFLAAGTTNLGNKDAINTGA
jgi:RNA polymerase sigma factor (sigma-70 family)